MALTPDDIVNYEFKQAMRGYSIPQVDDLLDRLADQVERAEREIDDLRQRLRDTEARLGSTLETESTLKRTLITAQQAAERALEDARTQADELRTAAEREVTEQLEAARKEAEEVTVRAREDADQLTLRAQEAARAEVLSAREERAALEARLEELREMEHRSRAVLRRHLESQLAVLDEFPGLPEDDLGASADRADTVAPAASPSLQVRVRPDDEPAEASHDEEPAAPASDEGEGLFDHDRIDITEEVAVVSPWEPAPEPASDEPRAGDQRPPLDMDPPSPWVQDAPSFPPPQAGEREDDRADEDAPAQPHVRALDPQHDRPQDDHDHDDDAGESDPYGHYDRFRDYRHHSQ